MGDLIVQSILELLTEEFSFAEIIRDYYPDLQVEDIRACLRYAIALLRVILLIGSCDGRKSRPA